VAAFRDELPGLLADDARAQGLSELTQTLSEFLRDHAPDGWEPPQLERRAIVHRHCHHQAVMGFDADRELLERMGLDVEVLDSGCCGMAGSFGFEEEHRDLSVEIGERELLPAVRDAPSDALIVADGFSCKTQIEQLTDRRGLHLAQVMSMAAREGPRGPDAVPPEAGYPDVVPAVSRLATRLRSAASSRRAR
jgi:Fe-S oxidoreductase